MIDLKHLFFFFSSIRNEAPKTEHKTVIMNKPQKIEAKKKPNSLSDLRHNDDTAKRNLYFAMIKVGRNAGSLVQRAAVQWGK